VEFIIRKIAHFTEYAAFGASLLFTTYSFLGAGCGENKVSNTAESGETTDKPVRHLPKSILFLLPWLFGTLYAATDEIHQLFVPGRYGKFHDVLIDSAGVAVGILICYFILRNLYKSRS
jgi:VanZ family protein